MLKKPPLKIDDLILFILSNSNPNMGIKKLNKLAFLLEFTYLFEHETPLTGANYAALQMGPVIDDYKDLMKRLVKEKKVCENDKADTGKSDYLPLKKPTIDVDLASFLNAVLDKYKELSAKQLEDLTHGLDSYNITIHESNDKMGGVIDKDLALLDSSLSLDDL
ncbi:MAG: hypothetical protein A2V81_00515 [Candidatus Abawacabacteria bacterium RBG_16_42_10]|uniref:Antitoxin SocA-like Panacea domain-containing protein n=1 Tax=Candidatus Abawacabacteria bacterium RBG_16_42_10 TaxID=1817814 RepID=A0A1F4XKN9_9BACT|nr:MAG: hypothetical protein A2V81_00515 [Candidatus Abawacabacteria bacterium RBG_16_42_10]